jgi:hypothetical protein
VVEEFLKAMAVPVELLLHLLEGGLLGGLIDDRVVIVD